MKTIDEIRYENLLALIKDTGSIANLARILGKSYAQISQLKNRSKNSTGKGKPRSIGDDLSREIEEKLNKQKGWMDTIHTSRSTFTERLGMLMMENGVSLDDLKDILSVPRAKAHRYALGDSIPSMEMIEKIASALECDAEWLQHGEAESKQDAATLAENDIIIIPQYDEGTSRSVFGFSKKWLNENGLNESNLRMFCALDNSMHPPISKDDDVMVDVSQVEPRENKSFLIERDRKELIVRKLVRDKDESWLYRAENTQQFSDMYPLQIDKIIGRVVWFGRNEIL